MTGGRGTVGRGRGLGRVLLALARLLLAGVVAMVVPGCLQSSTAGEPMIANETQEQIYLAIWSIGGSRSDPALGTVNPISTNLIPVYMPETGCLDGPGGWERIDVFVWPTSDPKQGMDADNIPEEPDYVHDLERDPICEGETWTWDGQTLLRGDRR